MKYEDDDALDAALFALPLEEPPADLRASILASTVLRPAPLFSFREILALGTLAAVTVWLIIAVVLGGGTLFLHTLVDVQIFLGRALSSMTTVLFIAAGGATAMWISLFTGFQSSAKVKAPERR